MFEQGCVVLSIEEKLPIVEHVFNTIMTLHGLLTIIDGVCHKTNFQKKQC